MRRVAERRDPARRDRHRVDGDRLRDRRRVAAVPRAREGRRSRPASRCSAACTRARSSATSSARRRVDGGSQPARGDPAHREREARGVVALHPAAGRPRRASSTRSTAPATPRRDEPRAGAAAAPLREFGLGAQVLADLGVHKLRLLTNNPRKIAASPGFGLEVVERVPLVSMKGEA